MVATGLSMKEFPEICGDRVAWMGVFGDSVVLMTELHMVVIGDGAANAFPLRHPNSEHLRSQPWYVNWVLCRPPGLPRPPKVGEDKL